MQWTQAILRIERVCMYHAAGVFGPTVHQWGRGGARERALAGLMKYI